MLIHSKWNQTKTFRLIPINGLCPYNEMIFDADDKVLVIISKDKKESFQMVPKFTDKGDLMQLKAARPNGKDYAEERRVIESWYEYYVENPEDMRQLIQHFASNHSTFNVEDYLPK